PPDARYARALHGAPRARLAGTRAALRGPLRRPLLSPERGNGADNGPGRRPPRPLRRGGPAGGAPRAGAAAGTVGSVVVPSTEYRVPSSELIYPTRRGAFCATRLPRYRGTIPP